MLRLERLPEYLTVTIATIAGVLFALYCGSIAGRGDFKLIGYFAAAIVFTILGLSMGPRIWLLIPLTWTLTAQSYLIPLPFSIREVSILLAFGLFLFLVAFKVVRAKPTSILVDKLLWLNLLYLLTVYFRNPVGVEALGTDLVGGRPYYITFICLCGYWVLSRVRMTPQQARYIPLLILASASLVAVLNIIAYRVPATVPVLAHIYSGVEKSSYVTEMSTAVANTSGAESVTGRVGALASFGVTAIALLSSLYPVSTLLSPRNFWRFSLFVLALLAVFYSGHRSMLMGCIATMFITTYFRQGILELVRLSIFILTPLALLATAQGTLFELPLVVQRTFTFLPGNWDQAAINNAKDSNEWRYEMWRLAMEGGLKGNQYIHNKWLGDGFGVSQKTLNLVMRATSRGEDVSQEGQMIVGGFHSGPISTLRFVGVVGGVLFYIWLFCLMRYSAALIRRAKGTPYYTISLFFTIPLIILPFGFTFVFGAYEANLPEVILTLGALKLIAHSLEAYQQSNPIVRPRKALAAVNPVLSAA